MRTEKLAGLTVRITGGLDRNGSGEGPLVVLLHGYGAPGTDLVGLWRELAVPTSVRFAFPEAPIRIPIGPGASGCAWWNIDMLELQRRVSASNYELLVENVPAELADARAQVDAHLTELTNLLEVPTDQLILGGFSQGAMLSCELAFSTDRKLAGLALLSGTLIHRTVWLEGMAARKDLSVLQSHGREDPILPFPLAERLRDDMLKAGLRVQFIPFSGGHGIGKSVMEGLQGFVNDAVRQAPPAPV